MADAKSRDEVARRMRLRNAAEDNRRRKDQYLNRTDPRQTQCDQSKRINHKRPDKRVSRGQ